MLTPWSLFELVDLFGVFVGAFSGALVARRHGYDITGLWGLAMVTGLGGGIIRNLYLQVGPPLALTEFAYLLVGALATLTGAFYGNRIDPRRGPIVFADSIALIGFAVAGSLRTINYDFGAWSTVLLGVVTAVGGGVLRDVLTGDTPMIFRRGELYAFAALGAGPAMVLADAGGVMVREVFAVGLGMRFGSGCYGWTA